MDIIEILPRNIRLKAQACPVYTLRETVYYDAPAGPGHSIHRLCELRRGCGCYFAVSAFLAIRHDTRWRTSAPLKMAHVASHVDVHDAVHQLLRTECSTHLRSVKSPTAEHLWGHLIRRNFLTRRSLEIQTNNFDRNSEDL